MRALSLVVLAACAGTGKVSSDAVSADGAGYADTDTDADSDTDADADADTDADSDTDTGAPTPASDDCTTAFTACGGDPTGLWELASLCSYGTDVASSSSYFGYFCPGDQLDISIVTSGTMEFASDGSYEISIGTAGSFTLAWPAACVQYAGASSCDDLVSAFDADSCVSDGAGGCVCTGDIYDAASNEYDTGSWLVSGDQIVLTDYYGSSDLDFCVDGDVLRLDDAVEHVDAALTR